MDFKSIALIMYPYWLLGAIMVWATIKTGHKDLVRVEKKGVKSWLKFLFILTVYRFLMFKLFSFGKVADTSAVSQIPWPLTLTVFWEDACHGLPLLLIRNFIGKEWWTGPVNILLTLIVMLQFGLGHTYQGVAAAVALSFYIPVSIHMAKKYGFGTVMICHTLYDLVTVLSLKYLFGV